MNDLDQHFTDDASAQRLVDSIIRKYDPSAVRTYLEPSCGGGAFVKALKSRGADVISVDIDSSMEADYHADFLELSPADIGLENFSPDHVIVIGNPPFGRAGALAKKFINHSMHFSNLICMVAPLSMLGARGCNALDHRLQLTWDEQLPEATFSDTTAKCCWQEWFVLSEGKGYRPPRDKSDTEGLYTLVSHKDDYNLVIQRCGMKLAHITECNNTGQGKYYISTPYPEVEEAFRSLSENLHLVPEAKLMTHQGTLSHALLHRLLRETLLKQYIARLTC